MSDQSDPPDGATAEEEAQAEARDREDYWSVKVVVWDGTPEGKTLTGVDAHGGVTVEEYVAERRELRADQARLLAEGRRLAEAAGIPFEECGMSAYAGGDVNVYRVSGPKRPTSRSTAEHHRWLSRRTVAVA